MFGVWVLATVRWPKRVNSDESRTSENLQLMPKYSTQQLYKTFCRTLCECKSFIVTQKRVSLTENLYFVELNWPIIKSVGILKISNQKYPVKAVKIKLFPLIVAYHVGTHQELRPLLAQNTKNYENNFFLPECVAMTFRT